MNKDVVFHKVVNLGTLPYTRKSRMKVFCNIELRKTEKGIELSITGVAGPLPSGNAKGGCGQIIMEFKEYDYRGYYTLQDFVLNPEWDFAMLKKFFDIWDRWHLNDIRAGCIHQEDKIRELKATGIEMKYPDSWYDSATRLEYEYCKECDYHYGYAWKFEEIPQDVIDFLKSLPKTKITPAWV